MIYTIQGGEKVVEGKDDDETDNKDADISCVQVISKGVRGTKCSKAKGDASDQQGHI